MNKPNKCKNCQWYGKPYWSTINPCDNCSKENDNITIVQIDGEPVFKETLTEEELKEAIQYNLDYLEGNIDFEEEYKKSLKEIQRLNNIITELEKEINNQLTMTRRFDKYNEGYFNATLNYYNKLNELKCGDNNGN